MNTSLFTFRGGHAIPPFLVTQEWRFGMAMTASEKSQAYQARERARIAALPVEEREAIVAEKKARRNAKARGRYARDNTARRAKNREADKARRRKKAAEEGRVFGRVGRDILATPEDKAARAAVRREKKRAYDNARYASIAVEKRAVSAAWYAENTERGKARSSTRYAHKKDEILPQQAAARRDKIAVDPSYRDKENAACRAKYAAKPDVYAAINRRAMARLLAKEPGYWARVHRSRYWADPEKARARGVQDAHARRARKLRAGGTFTAADVRDLLDKQKGRCFICLTAFGQTKPHVDHYIPLARGGTNDPRNLRLLCRKCNMSKHAKDPLDFARENGLLCW